MTRGWALALRSATSLAARSRAFHARRRSTLLGRSPLRMRAFDLRSFAVMRTNAHPSLARAPAMRTNAHRSRAFDPRVRIRAARKIVGAPLLHGLRCDA
jgi:hypothetical protein